MSLRRRRAFGALALLATAVIALTAAWLAARRRPQPASGDDPAAGSFLPGSAIFASAGAAGFAARQTPTVRGTAPYRLELAAAADKADAIRRVRRAGARVIGPYSDRELLIETSAWALARLSGDSMFAGAREVAPEEKIAAGYAGGLSVVVALSKEDAPRIAAFVRERGLETVETGPRPRHAVVVPLDLALARELAVRGEVRWIERQIEPRVRNDCAVVDTGVAAVRQTLGLTGDGELVATADSGIDTGDAETLHRDLAGRVEALVDLGGYGTVDYSGHGTHIAGTIAGDGSLSQGKYAGVAPAARLYVQCCGDSSGSPNIHFDLAQTYDDIFAAGIAYGACIHSDSWGIDDQGAYGTFSQGLDETVWKHPELLVVVANGNVGSGAQTVGTPATAKNCLSVGNVYSSRNAQTPGTVSNSSSRGPCADGRIKPEIVAPGVGIVSTRSSKCGRTPFDADGNYVSMTGTSMAAPHVAGAAALVREWLRTKRNFAGEPTAALLKAILTGGASRGGDLPDNTRGWGMLDLDETLAPTNRRVRLIDRVPFGSGVEQKYDFTLSDAADLDVQLAWIDYPGQPGAELALVNDLDLIVTNKTSGACWFGNGVDGGDRTNTVESVRIADASPGEYAVVVRSTSVIYSSMEGGASALYLRGAFGDGDEDAIDEGVCLSVDAQNGNDETADGSSDAPYASIAAAVAAAPSGAEVRVAVGVYAPFAAGDRPVRVTGVDGAGATVIDGGGAERCFTADGEAIVRLSGLTLVNGRADCGGGALGGELTGCVISNCVATVAGGGAYGSLLENCLVAGNAVESGASAYGGGVCRSALVGSTVVGNRAAGETKAFGGGFYGDAYGGSAVNSIVAENFASAAAVYGGDVYDGAGSMVKCHVGEGAGFADAECGDWRLATGSPCIDAGYDDCATTASDLAGAKRIRGAAVDLGCYEYAQTVAFARRERWCSNAEQEFAADVYADGDWRIESDSAWLAAQPASGTGNAAVYCRLTANGEGSTREGTLRLSGAGADDTAALAVRQLAQPPRKGGTRYGILAGLDEYDPNYIPSGAFLQGCVNDALAYRDCAVGSGMLRRENVWMLTNAAGTKAAIRARLNAVAAVAGTEDTVLYVHSGHGLNATDDPQFAAVGAWDGNYCDFELAEDLARFDPATKVIVVVDASHSAAMAESGSAVFAAGTLARLRAMRTAVGAFSARSGDAEGQVAFIAAAGCGQRAWDIAGQSEFTCAFTNGWLSGLADADGDGRLNFRELFDYAAVRAVGDRSDPWRRTEAQCFNEPVLLATLAEMIDPGWPDPGVAEGDTAEEAAAKVREALASAGIDERLAALVGSVEQYRAIAWWMATMEVSVAEFNAAAAPLLSAALGADGLLAFAQDGAKVSALDLTGGRCRLRLALGDCAAGRCAAALLPAAVAVQGAQTPQGPFEDGGPAAEIAPAESGLDIVVDLPEAAACRFLRVVLR